MSHPTRGFRPLKRPMCFGQEPAPRVGIKGYSCACASLGEGQVCAKILFLGRVTAHGPDGAFEGAHGYRRGETHRPQLSSRKYDIISKLLNKPVHTRRRIYAPRRSRRITFFRPWSTPGGNRKTPHFAGSRSHEALDIQCSSADRALDICATAGVVHNLADVKPLSQRMFRPRIRMPCPRSSRRSGFQYVPADVL